MIALAILVAVFGAVAIGAIVLVRRPVGAARMLRVAAFALTAFVAAILTPYVILDSGAATSYLLGVPVVAALLPMLATVAGRLVTVADVVGAVVLIVWGLILALGIGAVFLPSAALLLAAAVTGWTPRPTGTP